MIKKYGHTAQKKLNANCLNFLREIIGIFLGLFCWKERERELTIGKFMRLLALKSGELQ